MKKTGRKESWRDNKFSDRSMEVKLPALWGNYDPTNRPTDQTDIPNHREVSLPTSNPRHGDKIFVRQKVFRAVSDIEKKAKNNEA